MNQWSSEAESKLSLAYSIIVGQVAEHSCFSKAEADNLKDSGARIARGLMEMIWPRQEIVYHVNKALNTAFPVTGNPHPIIVGPIVTHGLCPHHFLPIISRVVLAYEPTGDVLGLSKIPRIVDALARRAVVQEQYTTDIAEVFSRGKLDEVPLAKAISPNVAVNVRAVHHCMICRGVKGEALTETEVVRGSFEDPNKRPYGMFSRFLLKDRE